MTKQEADFKVLCSIFEEEFKGIHIDTYNNAITTKILGTHVQFGYNWKLLPMEYTIGKRTEPTWTLLHITKEFKRKAIELGITYTSQGDGYGTMYL